MKPYAKTPVWIDVDTGDDDCFALLIAAHYPSLELLGVSTTHGNAPTIHTTNNTSSVLSALGRNDIHVYPGSTHPYCRTVPPAVEIHGHNGLGARTYLPEPKAPIRKDVNAIIAARDALMAQPLQTAWYVATGSLTNPALLFAVFPEVAHHIAGLSIMGGAVGDGFTSVGEGKTLGQGEGFGNETPWAEFNIYIDPESSHAIFSNAVLAAKTTLITLDLTHQCLATPTIRKLLLHGSDPAKKPSRLRLLLNEILEEFATSYDAIFDVKAGPPLHDPLAVAAIFGYASGIYDESKNERFDVSVVTDGAHGLLDSVRGQVGRTTVTKSETGQGIRIPRKLNQDLFWSMLEECCQIAEGHAAIPKYIYKILPYSPSLSSPLPFALPVSELDLKDGFLHLSTSRQLLSTLNRFFSEADAVHILRIDYQGLLKQSTNKVIWENGHGNIGREGEDGHFPHLYNGLKLGREEVDQSGTWEKGANVWENEGWPFDGIDVPA